jgi:hypothetical protein
MLRRVAFERTDVTDKCIASITWLTIIGELGTTLTVTSNQRMLRGNSDIKINNTDFTIIIPAEERKVGMPPVCRFLLSSLTSPLIGV